MGITIVILAFLLSGCNVAESVGTHRRQERGTDSGACDLRCKGGSRLDLITCSCKCKKVGLEYSRVKRKCVDIDECATDFGKRCQGNCTNSYRSFRCICPPGQILHLNGWQCNKVPIVLPCRGQICLDDATLNSSTCRCDCPREGYRYNLISRACEDIDECDRNIDSCQQGCVNYPGSYLCFCKSGYQLVANNNTCSSIPDTDLSKIDCRDNEFQCAAGDYCLDRRFICDGNQDCSDSTDEENCQYCYDSHADCAGWAERDECSLNSVWMGTNCPMSCKHCFRDDGIPGGRVTENNKPILHFLRNSDDYAVSMQYVQRNTGIRPGSISDKWQCSEIIGVPVNVRKTFGLSYFYRKYLHAYNIPIVGSHRVSDAALRRACYTVRFLLADRRDLRHAMYIKYVRVAVMAQGETTRNIPEHSHLPEVFNTDVRGLPGTLHMPIVTGAEENILCFKNDSKKGEDLFVHNLAHTIHKIALVTKITDFQKRLRLAYWNARRTGLWVNTLADDTSEEYFAEGVQSFFYVQSKRMPGSHNEINTRLKLERYDPALYSLMVEVFPCANRMADRCNTKGTIENTPMLMNCDGSNSYIYNTIEEEEMESDEDIIDEECVDEHEACQDWANLGECLINPEWMDMFCKKTCGTCYATTISPSTTETADPYATESPKDGCRDLNDYCPDWAESNQCSENSEWMKRNCPFSCNTCEGACGDDNSNCPDWAFRGECQKNPHYMYNNCRKSCNVC
ncbi:uncharacterized protein LOC117123400 [Anneissia japonica]|uniref:uncharacterized protein LOC117123400 n=1 Tax=Anneissia japonica TaxID=1529436 RepID=UPI001425606F|nr:uncharacterized protein LOC117123400 [Anneissia japonica]